MILMKSFIFLSLSGIGPGKAGGEGHKEKTL
jgi:hypothetical protein